MFREIVAVFVGGGIGSIIRYLISKISFFSFNSFPYSTFISNIIGCFILGLALTYFMKNDSQNSTIFIFIAFGFCGGFTTFSTFSSEGLELVNNGNLITFIVYTFTSIFLGIIAVYLGASIYK